MGASLSLAIKKKSLAIKTTGVVRTKESKRKGIELNISDEIFTEDEFADKNWNEFDLIVFGLPVNLTCQKINLIPENFSGVVTDLGSTKKDIIDAVEKKFINKHNYISSHPMAGSEQTGLEFAKENLYESKLCILTKPKNFNHNAFLDLKFFWEEIGSIIFEMNSIEHDEVLAYVSHTPHILSSILVNWAYANSKVQEKANSFHFPLTGGGFRDMSRIAGSNPEMWDAIINSNKKNIIQSLHEFKVEISKLEKKLESEEFEKDFWKNYFNSAKESRAKILKLKE